MCFFMAAAPAVAGAASAAGTSAALAAAAGSTAAAVSAGSVATALTAGGAVTAGMSTAAKLALAAQAGSAALSGYGMYQQQQGAKGMAKYQGQVAANNAKVSDWHAQDAVRRGELEAHEIRRRGSALRGQQRATMAARGLDLSHGTAADIVDDTDFFTSLDQNTARTNARKEAWTNEVQAGNQLGESSMYRRSAGNIRPGLSAGATLLGSGAQVANRWYQYS